MGKTSSFVRGRCIEFPGSFLLLGTILKLCARNIESWEIYSHLIDENCQVILSDAEPSHP